MPFKVHEMAKAWPKATPEGREHMKQSIKEVGLLEPMKGWVNLNGTKYCVDGSTRQELLAELVEEGTTHADNGRKIEERWEWLKGNELDVLEQVKALNGAARRHLKASQLAMIDVRNFKLESQYAAKFGIPEVIRPPTGELATLRARRGGYNRTYWFQCLRLDAEAMDLANEVADGHLTIPQAMLALNARQGKAVPSFNGPPPENIEVRDGLRNLVEGPYREIMVDRERFRALRQMLIKAQREYKALLGAKSGGQLNEGDLALIHDVALAVDQGVPFCVCPVCEGAKKLTGAKCGVCMGAGFITKGNWKSVPAKFKAVGVAED